MIEPLHVTPVDDIKEHQMSASCWCEPAVEDLLIIHNAADGREFYEEEELEWLATQRALDIMVADLTSSRANV